MYNIVLNHRGAGYKGVEFLAQKGYRDIVVISDSGHSPHSGMRLEGVREFLKTLNLPHGTVITTIRSPRPGVPYRASHVGLVIIDDQGKTVVRHAHRRRSRVIEQPLSALLSSARRARRWPVAGFHLLAIADRAPQTGKGPSVQGRSGR